MTDGHLADGPAGDRSRGGSAVHPAEPPSVPSSRPWPVYSPFAREHHGRGKREGLVEGREEGLVEGREEGLVEGRFQGEADAILKILKARNIVVPDDARTRIAECQDGAQLDEWLNRTLMATSVDDLFDVDVTPYQ